MVFTAQQAADIVTANAKVSADGPVSTHSDVEILNPLSGEILSWNGTNWTNTSVSLGTTPQQAADIATANAKVSADGPINTHEDINVSNPVSGEILSWNGTTWINSPNPGLTPQQAIDIATANAKVSANGSINTHSDVETLNPIPGNILTWNGTNWTNIISPPPPIQIPTSSPLTTIFPISIPPGPLVDIRDTTTSWNGLPLGDPTLPILDPPSYPWGANSHILSYAGLNSGVNLRDTGGPIPTMVSLYNSTNPFPTPASATISQLLNWNISVINRFRQLNGIQSQITLNQRLCNEALWITERELTTIYGPLPYIGFNTNYQNPSFPDLPSLSQQANYPGTPSLQRHSNWIKRGQYTTKRDPTHALQGFYQFVKSSIPFTHHMSSIIRHVLDEENYGGEGLHRRNTVNGLLYQPQIGISVILHNASPNAGEPIQNLYAYTLTFGGGPLLHRLGK